MKFRHLSAAIRYQTLVSVVVLVLAATTVAARSSLSIASTPNPTVSHDWVVLSVQHDNMATCAAQLQQSQFVSNLVVNASTNEITFLIPHMSEQSFDIVVDQCVLGTIAVAVIAPTPSATRSVVALWFDNFTCSDKETIYAQYEAGLLPPGKCVATGNSTVAFSSFICNTAEGKDFPAYYFSVPMYSTCLDGATSVSMGGIIVWAVLPSHVTFGGFGL